MSPAPTPRLAPPSGESATGARLIAHRGVPARWPELSADGLIAARDAGAPMIEIDARPTADGLMVVLHDPTPGRVTDCDVPVERLAARELLALERGDGRQARLLLLDEALALIVGRSALDLELKPTAGIPADEIAKRAVDALVRADSPQDVIVTSEDPAVLAAVRARAASLPTGLVFRSRDRRDPVALAAEVTAGVVVANRRRVDRRLVERARSAGLAVWAYVAPDVQTCRRLLQLGCERVFVDDYPFLAGRLDPPPATRTGPSPDEPRVLVIDLGSSSTKAALVAPGGRIIAIARAATPRTEAGDAVEHDADAVVGQVRELVDRLAEDAPEPRPHAAAIASQRSTGLWLEQGRPATAAVSWRDRRGADIVRRLEPRREEFERITGLPLDPAWTALKGLATLGSRPIDDRLQLVPLGSFVAAALTGALPNVDPTLANRMFLLDVGQTAWSPVMLAAFGLREENLPSLLPTVASRGALAWPGAPERVPLEVLIGDQPAAYIGLAGPSAQHLALNLGTAAFAMRARRPRTPKVPDARRTPLWTSSGQPRPLLVLDELPVARPADFPQEDDGDQAGCAIARDIALGAGAVAGYVERIAAAVGRLRESHDASMRVGGGMSRSPHMLALVRNMPGITITGRREPEATVRGAARLACAAARLAWTPASR